VRTSFSAPVQTDPGAHPASYTVGTGPFPGVKRPGRGVDHLPQLAPRLKKEWAIPLPPLWAFVGCSRVTFTFTCRPALGRSVAGRYNVQCVYSLARTVPPNRKHRNSVPSETRVAKSLTNQAPWQSGDHGYRGRDVTQIKLHRRHENHSILIP